jgi:hypothetical protein
VLLAIQGYLERLTVGILKSLQLYQLILLGLTGLIILQGVRIYTVFESRVIATVAEFEVIIQDTDMALVDELSLLKRFDLSYHADGSAKSTQMDASILQTKSHAIRRTNTDDYLIRSSPRLA